MDNIVNWRPCHWLCRSEWVTGCVWKKEEAGIYYGEWGCGYWIEKNFANSFFFVKRITVPSDDDTRVWAVAVVVVALKNPTAKQPNTINNPTANVLVCRPLFFWSWRPPIFSSTCSMLARLTLFYLLVCTVINFIVLSTGKNVLLCVRKEVFQK